MAVVISAKMTLIKTTFWTFMMCAPRILPSVKLISVDSKWFL